MSNGSARTGNSVISTKSFGRRDLSAGVDELLGKSRANLELVLRILDGTRVHDREQRPEARIEALTRRQAWVQFYAARGGTEVLIPFLAKLNRGAV